MAEEILASVQVRRDSKVNWKSVNPILLNGEAAYEQDTDMFKIGDGVKRYSDLPYHNKVGPQGPQGEPGPTPQISMNVSTGNPGTSASVNITGTAENPVINLTVPRGDTGKTGSTGPKGDTGSSGVYIGTSQPTDSNINVWIDSDGEPTEVIDDFAREEIGSLKDDLVNETNRAINREYEIEKLFKMPTQEAVNTWLDEHPEATTTVQDKSLTCNKFVVGTLGYVTPEMFGAIGDGITDDTKALNDALRYGYTILLQPNATYLVTGGLYIRHSVNIDGNYSSIIVNDYQPKSDDVYGLIRYAYGIKNYDVRISDLTINFNDTNFMVTNRHDPESELEFPIFFLIGENKTELENVSVNIAETEKRRHIISVTNTTSLKKCKFTNKSYGYSGGVFWVKYGKEDVANIIIDGCCFESHSADENFAAYGSGEKNIIVKNTKFLTDSSKFTKNTIMFAFYDGKNNIIFDNCQIYQSGESESNLHLNCILRLGDYDHKCTAVLNNCYIDCDLYSSVFARATTDLNRIDNDVVPNIILNNCTIVSKNCPLNGNFVSYVYGLTGGYSVPCVNMEVNKCRINCSKSLFDINNQIINPAIFKIIDSVVYISNAKTIGFFNSKSYEARYMNTKFYINETLGTYFVDVNSSRHGNFNDDEFCPYFIIENCYLNNETFTNETN